MSKRKRIIFVILALVVAVALIVSLAACKPKTPPKPPTPPEPAPVANPGGEKLQGAVSYLETTVLKDLAKGLGVDDGKPQIRIAADVSLDVDIDKAKAGPALQGILGDDFEISDNVKVKVIVGLDVVVDKDHPENNIVTVNIAASNKGAEAKNILSLCGRTEMIENVPVSRLYIGERLLHTGEMNWVKVDYPEVDYIDWVAGQLDTKYVPKTGEEKSLLAKLADGNFVSALKIGTMEVGGVIMDLLPNLPKPGEMLQLFTYTKLDGNAHKFAINFKNIGNVLNNLKAILSSVDASGLFADMDEEVQELLNGAIGLVLGSDPKSTKNGIDQLLKGEISPENQPEISIIFYNDSSDTKLEGLGLHYDGTVSEKNNGVKFKLDIKNLKIQNLKTGGASEAREAAENAFVSKAGTTKAKLQQVKPLALQLEVDLLNETPVANRADTFKNLESAKVVVDVYPSAKLGWRKATKGEDTTDYFAANVNQTYAEATFTYKKIGGTEQSKLIGVLDCAGESKGIKLDIAPVFNALGVDLGEQQNVFMAWNTDLSNEITKWIEGIAADNGYTLSDYTPAGLMNAAGDITIEGNVPADPTPFGKFINELINPSDTNGKQFILLDAEGKDTIVTLSAKFVAEKTEKGKTTPAHYSAAGLQIVEAEEGLYKIQNIADLTEGFKLEDIEISAATRFRVKKDLRGKDLGIFSIGKAIGGIKYIFNNILVKAMNDDLGDKITITADDTTFASLLVKTTDVKSLFQLLLAETEEAGNPLKGLIGKSGIYWYEGKVDANGDPVIDPVNGNQIVVVKTLKGFLEDWTLNKIDTGVEGIQITDFISKVVGAEIPANFWTAAGTELSLAIDRNDGLAVDLGIAANGVKTEGADPVKLAARVKVRLNILGKDMPERKEIAGFNAEGATVTLFGLNNYDEALTTEQHNAWKEVMNSLLSAVVPTGFVPFKYQVDVTLDAGEGNYGQAGEPAADIKIKTVAVNQNETVAEYVNGNLTFAVPNAPAGQVFDKWQYMVDTDNWVDFVFGSEGTVIPEAGLTLKAVYKAAE